MSNLHPLVLPATYMACVGLLFITLFCGDPSSGNLLGRMNIWLTKSFPLFLGKAIRMLPLGERIATSSYRLFCYVFFERNPLMQLFYLFIIIGSYSMFMLDGMQYIPNPYLPWYHRYLSFAIVSFVLLSFVIASRSDPGYITDDNVELYEKSFEYDGFMFVKHDCSTCKTPKPARSKHCGMCNKCIAKFDHHCPWINVCVGEKNHRWFLLFVGSTTYYLLYASWGLASILLFIVEASRIWSAKFVSRSNPNDVVEANLMIVFQFLLGNHPIIVILFVIAFVMGIAMLGFFIYHIYLVIAGTTTNESSKWSSIKHYYKEINVERKVGKYLPTKPLEELLDPSTNKSLGEREPEDFPLERPKNKYYYGIVENVRLVFFPRCIYNSKLNGKTSSKINQTELNSPSPPTSKKKSQKKNN